MTVLSTWMGRTEYRVTLERQRRYRDAVVRGCAPEMVWALEHEPVITTGRRPVEGLPSAAWCRDRGVTRCSTERGGLATFHGPGQLVLYFLVDVSMRGGIRQFVCHIEEGVSGWLRSQGIDAAPSERGRGVWVGTNKICSVGLHIRRGIAMHGFALNLSNDLGPFTWFSPCGFDRGSVTSVLEATGRDMPARSVWRELVYATLPPLVDSQERER